METALYVLGIVYYTMAICSLVSEKLEARPGVTPGFPAVPVGASNPPAGTASFQTGSL